MCEMGVTLYCHVALEIRMLKKTLGENIFLWKLSIFFMIL